MTKRSNRVLSLVLSVLMLLSLLPIPVAAAPETSSVGTEDNPYITKTATYDPATGKYTLQLESWVTGSVTASGEAVPMDIVLVLDQSGSMRYDVDDLEAAVTGFVNTVSQNAAESGVDHRIALVGYASDSDDGASYTDGATISPGSSDSEYVNTGLYIDGFLKNYARSDSYREVYAADLDRNQTYYISSTWGGRQAVTYDPEQGSWGYWETSLFGQRYWQSVTPKENSGQWGGEQFYELIPGWTLTAEDYQAALVSVNTNGSVTGSITTAIGNLAASGGTRTSYGMEMAANIFANNDGTGRQRLVVLFTDGEPGPGLFGQSFSTTEADRAISQSYTCKNTYGAQVYSIGMYSQATSNVTNFMNYVSSNYPNAQSMNNPGWREADTYYMTASNSSALDDIFQQIAESVTTPAMELTETAVLTDTLSEYFTLPEGATSDSITLQTADYLGNGAWAAPVNAGPEVTATVSGKTVSVTGFDYAANCVTEDPVAGKKLIVSFEIVPDPEATWGEGTGYYPTNDTDRNKAGVFDGTVGGDLSTSPTLPVTTYQVSYQWAGLSHTEFCDAEGNPVVLTLPSGGWYPAGTYPVNNGGYQVGDKIYVKDENGVIIGEYTFVGWDPADQVTVGPSVTVIGTWEYTSRVFTVTYNEGDHGTLAGDDDGDGNVVHPDLTYGSATPTPPTVNPEDGWYFVGWLPTVAPTVTETVTYVAQYATKTAITITGQSDTRPYNGSYQEITDILVTGLPEGYTLSGLSYAAGGTDVDTYTGVFTGEVQILDAQGNDVTHQFQITGPTPGTLTITPLSLTITAASDEKIYDGDPLTNGNYTVTGELADGDTLASVTVTGSQTDVGDSANVPSAAVITRGGVDVTHNYQITYVNGTLTVKADTGATLEATPYTGIYDGAYHDGVVSLTLKDGNGNPISTDGWTITYNGEATMPQYIDADSYPITIVASNANYRTLTVTVTAVISPRQVTLTSGDASKIYDGDPLTNETVTVGGDGFVEGEGATYSDFASIVNVGNTDNTFTYTLTEGTKTGNYTITQTYGTLTILPVTSVITITAKNDSKTYDGTPLTNSGYDVSGALVEGDVVEAVVEGTITNVTEGGVANVVTSYRILRNGVDVTNNYSNVTTANGVLNILPRQVTLTSGSASKNYDGDPLTREEVTVSGDGFVAGEGATWSNFASITDVGRVENTFEYTLNPGTLPQNYNITVEPGTLEIFPNPNATLTVSGYEGVYDGQAHSITHVISGDVAGTVWTYEYSTDGVTWSSTLPTFTHVHETTATVHVRATNPNYTTLTGAGQVVITPKPVTLSSHSATKPYDGTPLTRDGLLGLGDFVGDEGIDYQVTGWILDVGRVDNTFTYTFKSNTLASDYAVTEVYGELEITPYTAELVVTADSGSKPYDGTALVVPTATYNASLLQNGDILQYTVEGSQTNVGTSDNVVTSVTITRGGVDVTGNYSGIKTVNGTLEVTKKQVTLTSGSAEKTYDGNPLTNHTVTAEGFAPGEGATYDVTGSQTVVGESENTFTYTLNPGTLAENYEITVKYGTLKVNPVEAPIVLQAGSAEKTYDGTPLTEQSFTIVTGADQLAVGDQIVVVIDSTITNAGQEANKITSHRVLRGDVDVTNNYTNISYLDGTLKINPRQVTLTSATDSKPYDGTPLTNDTITVGGDGFVEGEGVTCDVTGSQTDAGSSLNTFTYTFNEGTLESNYVITKSEGTLTVYARTGVVVTITENSATVTYNGEEQSVTGYTVSISDPLYTEEDFIFTGDDVASGVVAGFYPMELTPEDFTNVNGNFENVVFQIIDGGLTIEPVDTELVITANSAERAYDGTPLTDDGYTWTQGVLVDGDVIEAVVEGSITDVGSVDNVITSYRILRGGVDVTACYSNVTLVNGTLTVTPREVLMVSGSQSWIYDGQEHAYPVVEAVGFVEGEGATYSDFATIRDRGTVPNTFTYTLNENTDPDNYTITVEYGTLTILAKGFNVIKSVDKFMAYVGEWITYTITVSNTGDVPIYDIRVVDEMLNVDIHIDVLEPGEVKIWTYTYKLEWDDLGVLKNTVVVTGEDLETEDSVEVRVILKPDQIGGGGGSTAKPELNVEDHVAYIIGYEDGLVRPQASITRAEVATIFFRLLTDESRSYYWSQTNAYSDVDSDDWFNNAVSTMSNAGVLTGYPDGTFRPNEPITRAEFAAIAARFSDVVYRQECTFTDVEKDHWAATYIALAEHLGWINGYPDGTFRPDTAITRAETMTLVNRVLERAVEEEHMLPHMVRWPDCQPDDWFYEAVQEATNSHDYVRLTRQVPDQDFCYEDWQTINDNPDWAALERTWSRYNSQH